MMLLDCGELGTDFGPLCPTFTCQTPWQGQGIGKRLIDAQADGDHAPRLR